MIRDLSRHGALDSELCKALSQACQEVVEPAV